MYVDARLLKATKIIAHNAVCTKYKQTTQTTQTAKKINIKPRKQTHPATIKQTKTTSKHTHTPHPMEICTVRPVVSCASEENKVNTLLATFLNFGCSLWSGCTKCSISAMQNSRTRSNPLRGAISLRNPKPICAAAKGMRCWL